MLRNITKSKNITKGVFIKKRELNFQGKSKTKGDNSLAGELIYTVYEVTVAAIHTVGLLCVVASSGVA